jgi:hypothetical protein
VLFALDHMVQGFALCLPVGSAGRLSQREERKGYSFIRSEVTPYAAFHKYPDRPETIRAFFL